MCRVKKIFKCKNLFLVTFLAIAGFFSATAIIKDKQVEETPVVEKAEATALTFPRYRIYAKQAWSNHGNPIIHNTDGSGYDNQFSWHGSISYNSSTNTAASGTIGTMGTDYDYVMDVTLSEGYQSYLSYTWYGPDSEKHHGYNDRYIPWTTGQSSNNQAAWNNGLLNGTTTSNVGFTNGYIYRLHSIAYKDEGNYTDQKDNVYRTMKWFTYTLQTYGVFIHYDLNGGQFSDNTKTDFELAYNGSVTLAAAPTRSGYTFMGWESSNNGILNRASTTYTSITKPLTFTAIWASNTIQVVGGTGTGNDSNVRVWIGYANSGSGVGSLMYNGYGTEPKLWVHQGDNSKGDYELVLSPTGTIYNNAENAASDLTNCPRRFDYYDVPRKYFTNSCYLNLQRFSGGSCTNTSGQLKLSETDDFAFKIIYIQQTWENTPVASDITSNKSNSLIAAYGLSGIKTCCANKMNGYGGYNRWYSTFAQSNTSIINGLSNYHIIDYITKSDYSSESDIGRTITAQSKYEWVKFKATGGSEPTPGHNLGNFDKFNPSVATSEDSSYVIIIIVASSVSILSITALSVLLVKKRKSKQQ